MLINSAKAQNMQMQVPSMTQETFQGKILKKNKSLKRSLGSRKSIATSNLVDSSVEFMKLLESQVSTTH